MSSTSKNRVPPEVAYLPEDSIVRGLPLSSFVIGVPGKREEQEEDRCQETQRRLDYFGR